MLVIQCLVFLFILFFSNFNKNVDLFVLLFSFAILTLSFQLRVLRKNETLKAKTHVLFAKFMLLVLLVFR